MDANEAREALAQIAQTRTHVSVRVKAPKGYYAVVGFLQALYLTSITLDRPWSFVLLIPGLAALGLVVGWYRNSVGAWGWADVKGEGAGIFWLMVAITVVAFGVVLALRTVPVGLGCGAVVFITYAVLGPIWDRAYQRQVAQH